MSNTAGVVLLTLGLFLFFVMVIGLLLAPPATQATPESPLKLQPSPPAPEEVPEPDVFEQLERLGEAGKIKAAEDAKARPWLRPIGFVSRLLTYAALFFALYIWAPKDISTTPLATLTLSDIAGTAFFVGVAVVLIRALFNPSEDDAIKDGWGWLGVVILGGLGIGALYLYKAH